MLLKETSTKDGTSLRVGYLFSDRNRYTALFFNAVGMKVETLNEVANLFFGEGINFITWEHRSCPGRSYLSHDLTMETQLGDAARVASEFRLQSAAVLGWCTGASIAIQFMSKHSSFASRSVFIDGAFLFKGEPGGDLGNAMFEMCGMVNDNDDLVDYFHKATQPNEQKIKTLGLGDAKWLESLVMYPYTGSKQRLRSYCKAIMHSCAFDPTIFLENVSCPSLVFGAKNDRMVHYENAVRASEIVRECQLVITEQGSHYSFFQSQELQKLAAYFVKNNNADFRLNEGDFVWAT